MNSANRDSARRAIKAREQGQARIRSVTTAVTTASVITAGAVALILPGSSHATGPSTPAPKPAPHRTSRPAPSVPARAAAPDPSASQSGASAGSANSSSGASGFSPSAAPGAGSGGGQVTSGGT
jgi:hypothetical protein